MKLTDNQHDQQAYGPAPSVSPQSEGEEEGLYEPPTRAALM